MHIPHAVYLKSVRIELKDCRSVFFSYMSEGFEIPGVDMFLINLRIDFLCIFMYINVSKYVDFYMNHFYKSMYIVHIIPCLKCNVNNKK